MSAPPQPTPILRMVHVDNLNTLLRRGGMHASNHTPDDGLPAIRSPMVGTFYRAPTPEAQPFVEPGSRVSVGQVVCIVEAMKHMNEIESEIAGEIVETLVENGASVDFNQPLFKVRPHAS